MAKVRVFLVDDHAILRAGLRLLFNAQADMEVVGEAGTIREALIAMERLAPDVVCLDWSLRGESGLTLLEKLKVRQPRVKVVVLTMHDDPAYLRQAVQSGASAFVVKQADEAELLLAIRAAHQGRTFFSLPASPSSTDLLTSANTTQESADLSDRERQVLLGIVGGYTNLQVAEQLDISVKSVETYRARLLTKLGLRTRSELVRYALEYGLMKKT